MEMWMDVFGVYAAAWLVFSIMTLCIISCFVICDWDDDK